MHLLKNNRHVVMKKTLGILFLIFAGVWIAGCSADGAAEEKTANKNEQAIQAVIDKEFTGPDEKYNELWDKMEEAQVSDRYIDDYEAFLKSSEYQDLMNYMQETYSPYFTENGYDTFINTAAFAYSGFDHDYKLTPSNIEIVQNEHEPTLYNITFQVGYTDENGKSKQFNFKGQAIVPEEGKIGKIEYLDGYEEGLLEVLRTNEEQQTE